MFLVLFVYAVFSFLIVPFACGDYYGVLVVVHYYRACYCEIAETLVHDSHWGISVCIDTEDRLSYIVVVY